LSEKVSIDSENQQTPQSRRLTSHEGEFIFISKVEKIIINEATINIVDTTNTIDYDILAKKIAEANSPSLFTKIYEKRKIIGIVWFVLWIGWGLIPPY